MARFRPSRLFRRFSSRDAGSVSPSSETVPTPPVPSTSPRPIYSSPAANGRLVRESTSLPKLRKKSTATTLSPEVPEAVKEQRESALLLPGEETRARSESPATRSGSETLAGERRGQFEEKSPEVSAEELHLDDLEPVRSQPILVVQEPTPAPEPEVSANPVRLEPNALPPPPPPVPAPTALPPEALPTNPERSNSHIRKPSIVDSANAKIITTLLDAPAKRHERTTSGASELPTDASLDTLGTSLQNMAGLLHRKIWVKRPGASATLVQIREDDLVDDVRDMILRKYANSLGKTFDAPDMTLHIVTRPEHGQPRDERLLGPEEQMCRTIDSYYSGGQTVDEALLIHVPQRRTPRPSPRVMQPHQSYHNMDDYRPLETGNDYFPTVPAVVPQTVPQTTGSHDSRVSNQHHSVVAASADHPPRSISVLNTGHIPPLPSPGGHSRRHQHRPKYLRQPTSSPTIITSNNQSGAVAVNAPAANPQQPPGHMVHRQSTRPRMDSNASEARRPNGGPPEPPPLPSPPAPEAAPTNQASQPATPSGGPHAPHQVGTHPSQRPARPKKGRKPTPDKPSSKTRHKTEDSSASQPGLLNSMLDGSVPPINVLIVEDNIINLRILEGLMKRLKVRWETAMNGQIALDKWRLGGYHLVLMDIQMPVMNGLQATKEIRRLERVNGIGVFSSSNTPSPTENQGEANGTNGKGKSPESDKLENSDGRFKSPIIIVALTASSLQSDRHEALAAGCNDFLTKPVNFVWLERKVKEWGCMQALIDFDGWRRWKDYAAQAEAGKTEEEKQKEREKEKKEKIKMEKMAILQEKQKQAKAKEEKDKKKRQSMSEAGPSGSPAGANQGASLEVNGSGTNGNGSLRSGAEVLGATSFELGG